jgi:DNA-directed RNA polymerase specialized sigma24 family protein
VNTLPPEHLDVLHYAAKLMANRLGGSANEYLGLAWEVYNKALPSFNAGRASLKTYIVSCCARRIIDEYRKREHRKTLFIDDDIYLRLVVEPVQDHFDEVDYARQLAEDNLVRDDCFHLMQRCAGRRAKELKVLYDGKSTEKVRHNHAVYTLRRLVKRASA